MSFSRPVLRVLHCAYAYLPVGLWRHLGALLPVGLRRHLGSLLAKLTQRVALIDVQWRLKVQVPALLTDRQLDAALAVAAQFVSEEPITVAQICEDILAIDDLYAGAYRLLVHACRAGNLHDRLKATEDRVVAMGMRQVGKGELTAAVQFFQDIAVDLADVCEPYVLLYRTIDAMAVAQNAARLIPRSGSRRRLIISVVVWGARYVDLFTRYFVPSILSQNNVPKLTKIRDVQFDIYTTAKDVTAIREAASIAELSRYAEIQLIEFPERILQSSEYARKPHIRYYIYGGFHHVSMARARAIGADIICIAPDGVHSDGSFYNYARFIDEGYKAVLFTATRGQAETLLPVLDGMRDDKTQSITLPPRKLVALAAQNIHHDFQRYILAKENVNVPDFVSIMFFPQPHGFNARCFHLHPIIIAAEALRAVPFDNNTADANLTYSLFPMPEDWQKLKIIDDSDDGVMLDLTYVIKTAPLDGQPFDPEILIRQMPYFFPNHFWHFKTRIVCHTDEVFDTLRTFDLDAEGHLVPKYLSTSSSIDMNDEALLRWFERQRTDQAEKK